MIFSSSGAFIKEELSLKAELYELADGNYEFNIDDNFGVGPTIQGAIVCACVEPLNGNMNKRKKVEAMLMDPRGFTPKQITEVVGASHSYISIIKRRLRKDDDYNSILMRLLSREPELKEWVDKQLRSSRVSAEELAVSVLRDAMFEETEEEQ